MVDRVMFVGIGTMGSPMVRHVAKGGFELLLNDVNAAHATEVANEVGAVVVTDAAAHLAGVNFLVLMLPNSSIVETVVDDLLPHLGRGSVIVDMSSSEPARTVQLASRAAQVGVELVDAPVSGGQTKAISGELTIMVGGSKTAVDRSEPLLATMGSTIIRVGSTGSGHAMKALNNLLSAVGIVAASEVLSIGQRFGLDPHVMLDALNRSTGRNQATEVKFAKFILSRAFDSGFSLDLMVKDLATALDLAKASGASAPVSASAYQTWIGAQTMLAGQGADHTEVSRYVERAAGADLGSTHTSF